MPDPTTDAPAILRLAAAIPPTAAEPDPLAALLSWAARVAREVRRAFRFRPDSAEEDDLVAEAHATVCRLAERFDPSRVPPGGDAAGLFRGWSRVEVRSECRRLARRLRNGGTYHSRREEPGVAVVATPISDLSSHDGTPFDAPARPDPTPPPAREPAARPEPGPAGGRYAYGRRLAMR